MLVCPKCNFDNELGRIFCHQCGAKLDLSQIKPPSQGTKVRRRIQRGVAQTVRLVIQAAIAAVLALGIALLCLSPEVKPVKPTADELRATDKKHADLERLVNGRESGKVVISEGEFNAFLGSLAYDRPKGTGVEVTPTLLRISLTDGAVKIELLGVIHFGTFFDKNLYLAYVGRPASDGRKFTFTPTGGWIGMLPIHPKLVTATPFFENYFGTVFGKLENERALLDKLTAITVTGESIVLEREVPAQH